MKIVNQVLLGGCCCLLVTIAGCQNWGGNQNVSQPHYAPVKPGPILSQDGGYKTTMQNNYQNQYPGKSNQAGGGFGYSIGGSDER